MKNWGLCILSIAGVGVLADGIVSYTYDGFFKTGCSAHIYLFCMTESAVAFNGRVTVVHRRNVYYSQYR